MFLSNALRIACLVIILIALAAACGSSQPQANTSVSIAPAAQGNIPFSLKEPENYSAEAHITTPEADERFFIARKGDKWRFDTFRGQTLVMSQICVGQLYYIDHERKLLAVAEQGDPMAASLPPDPAQNFYRSREHFDFEQVGRDGAIIKYRAISKDNVFIYYDTAKGLITRQEFTSSDDGTNLVYELRDVKTDVDDSAFELPKGYKKTAVSDIVPEN